MESAEFIINRARRRGIWTFLHIGKWEKRKNTEMLVRCFYDACNHTKVHAELRLKCSNPFNPNWETEYCGIRNKYESRYGKSTLIWNQKREYSAEEMVSLYHDCDFGLYASSGEAWNLSALESIACGLPTITTDFAGQSEYLAKYPKEFIVNTGTKKLANDGLFFKGDRGCWIEPDDDELFATIVHVLRNAEKIYESKRDECVNAVRKFTWANVAKKLI